MPIQAQRMMRSFSAFRRLTLAVAFTLGMALVAFHPVAIAQQGVGADTGEAHSVPFFPSVSNAFGLGVVRVVNRSDSAGTVSITAFDDAGEEYGPVTLSMGALQTAYLNSVDLEDGNADKGISSGVGPPSQGNWRLELTSDLNIKALTYINSSGSLASMHDVAPIVCDINRIAFFNPGSNLGKKSLLRLVNPGDAAAEVTIRGVDDRGQPGAAVRLSIAPRAARMISASELEDGSAHLDGALGDGTGKWRLDVEPDRPIIAMSLLAVSSGHLTNLSTDPSAGTDSTGGRIAFTSNREGNHEIYVMNADGSDVTRLTDTPANEGFPTWSPDGQRIAFQSRRGIYVMDADGSNVTHLTTAGGTPAWSPDGRRIAFQRDNEIHVMNADGTGVTNLGTNVGTASPPAWSPDGRRIAFESHRNGTWGIYVIDADGSNVAHLAASGGDGTPAWSPDGRRIAFTSQRDGVGEIYVMNADGSNAMRLTNFQGFVNFSYTNNESTWSPDGRRIAFRSNRDNRNREIYVMDADGSNVTRLTDDSARDESPAWSPDAECSSIRTSGNRPPVLTGRAPSPNLVVGDSRNLNLVALFTDPDGDTLTYSATSSDTSVVTTVPSNPSGSTLKVSAVAAGTAAVAVTATDPGGLIARQGIQVTVTAAAAPDLVVQPPTVSNSSPSAGASFTLRATVRNSGAARSAATTLRYYRSSDATISTSDTAVGTDPVRVLSASGTSAESVSLTAPSSAGTYYYGACVDTVTGESDTTNNCSSAVRVTVQGSSGPAITGSLTECTGRRTSFLAVAVSMSGTLQAHRSVSSVRVIGRANGQFIDSESLGNMSSGQSRRFTLTGTLLDSSATKLDCDVEYTWFERRSQGAEVRGKSSMHGPSQGMN